MYIFVLRILSGVRARSVLTTTTTMVPPPVYIMPDSSVIPPSPLPSSHFLSQPRLSVPSPRTVDTSTLNAHDFDVDNRTGFMPFEPPLARLSGEYEAWEILLDEAQQEPLQLGRRPDLTQEERECSAAWRARVREVSPSLLTELVRVHWSVSALAVESGRG